MSITNFLPDKMKVQDITEEVQTDVFDAPVVVKLIDQKDTEKLMNICTVKDKRGKNVKFDQGRYVKLLTIASIVEPPLDSAELQDQFKVMGAEALFDKMFPKYKDAQKIINAAMELNDADADLDELIDEAKN